MSHCFALRPFPFLIFKREVPQLLQHKGRAEEVPSGPIPDEVVVLRRQAVAAECWGVHAHPPSYLARPEMALGGPTMRVRGA